MPPHDVSPAAPHELLPACRLLFRDGRAELSRDRILTDANTCGLFVARSGDGRLHAAALVQVLPGALGVAWAPRGDSAEAVDAVTAAACDWLRSRGVKVGQAFAAAGEAADMIPLERAGFRPTTQLVFLKREVGSSPDGPTPPARWSSWSGSPTGEQLALLLATHDETLDCPELNAPRTADEIADGFRPAQVANCSWWNTLDTGDEPVGVLLFDRGNEEGAIEVSYLGLVPWARGRGLAGTLLRFATHVAANAGYRTLTVSVDVRNTPAMRLYARHGFVEYGRRAVWLLNCAR